MVVMLYLHLPKNPSRDQDQLRRWGLSAVFGPGTSAEAAINHIRDNVRQHSPSGADTA
jgi:methylmalonyl-CoA mutase cobalamin-binding subunit